MKNSEPHCKVSVYAALLCLFQKRTRPNHPSKKSWKLFLLGLIISTVLVLPEQSYGQFIPCKNSNDEEPSYNVPGTGSGSSAILNIDINDWYPDGNEEFCIKSSGDIETTNGCGTFVFQNLNTIDEDCPQELCFFPRKGCGQNTGLVCLWQEDPNNAGEWISVGAFDNANFSELCFPLPEDQDEFSITVCRANEGSVSLQNVQLQPVCEAIVSFPEITQEISVNCEDDIPTAPVLQATNACGDVVATEYLEWRDNGDPDCANNFVITRKWSAENSCGEEVAAMQIITVKDGDAPVLSGTIPADASYTCGTALPAAPIITATDNCEGSVDVEYVEWRDNGDCDEQYVITRKWTATDKCGNETVGMQIITISDEEAPVFSGTIPTDAALSCGATLPAAPIITATDNCEGSVDVEYVEWRDNGDCDASYVITRKWTAADKCGNEIVGMQIITVADDQDPVINGIPADATVACDELPAAPVLKATDECDTDVNLEYIEWRDNGECDNEYTITRKWTATDDCGNETIGMQILTVVDNKPPVLSNVPADVTVACAGALPLAINPTAVDECGGTVTFEVEDTFTEGACGDKTYTRTYIASDACGNEATATQTIIVEGAPLIEIRDVPADITLSCGDVIPTPMMPNATTDCILDAIIKFKEESTAGQGDCANSYIITRTFTATDYCDNSVSATQIITIIDDEAPVFNGAPADVAVDCNNIPAAPVMTATDDCDGVVPVEYLEWRDNGDCDDSYVLTRKWTATDDCGNEGVAMQIITVTDNTPPVISNIPANAVINCGEELPAVITPTATDDCGGAVNITLEETQGGQGCGSSVVIRTWTATDACGNSSTATQEITVHGSPVISLANVPEDTWFSCSADVPAEATVTGTDACGGTYTVTFDEVQTTGDCAGTYVITRTWTADDGCGTAATSTQTITIIDEVAPVFSGAVSDVTIECGEALPGAPVLFATDNCGQNIAVDFVLWEDAGSCEYNKTITRKWSAVDACGNEAVAMQVITIEDTTPPVITNAPANVVVNCGEAMPDPVYPIAEDACGDDVYITYEENQTGGDCGSSIVTRLWTLTDDCGNTTTYAQEITQQGAPAMSFNNVPQDITLECGQSIPTGFNSVTASDACGVTYSVNMEQTTTEGIGCGTSTITRTWIADDGCGGTISANQVITLQESPVISLSDAPADVTIGCGQAIPAVVNVTASDNCGTTYSVAFDEQQSGNSCGSYTLTRTWTATTDCGQTATASQVITVQGSPAISLSNPPADATIGCGQAVPAATSVTASDACGTIYSVAYDEQQSGNSCGSYTLTRTWTATTSCGQTATASQVITVQGSPAISLSNVPADATIGCGQPVPAASSVSANDACGTTYSVAFDEQTSGSTCGDYILTRTWTATTTCGQTATANQVITVQGSPTISLANLPADATIGCGQAVPAATSVTASDACGTVYNVSLSEQQSGSNAGGDYTITRTWTAATACGQTATGSQVITVKGSPAISLTGVPADAIIGCGQGIPSATNVTASDALGFNYNVSVSEQQSGSNAGGDYTITRTWSAVTACGQTATGSQVITVKGSPSISLTGVPADATIGCGQVIPSATNVTASDALGFNYNVNLSEQQSGSTCGTYTVTRTWTAATACGQTATASQVITVQGAANVTLFDAPTDITVSCGQTVPTAAPVYAKDECGTSYIVSLEETQSASTCGSYVMTRVWTAPNGCGGEVTATQQITVQGANDILLYSVPSDATITCGQTVPNPASVTAADACGNAYTVSFNETQSGNSCSNYTLVRTWTAVDGCGGQKSATQTIQVQGSPQLTLSGIPANATIPCGQPLPATPSVTASDDCGFNYNVNFEETQTETGCDSYSLTRTWTAATACGQTATASQVIKVEGNPVLTLSGVPTDATVNCGQTVPTAPTVYASDACGFNYNVNFNETQSGSTCGIYTLTRTWSAATSCGGTASASQVITVNGASSISLQGVPADATVDCGQTVPGVPSVTAIDACGIAHTVNFTESQTQDNCGANTITRTWTANDGCGGTTSASQIVFVEGGDDGLVFYNVPGDQVVSCGQNIPAAPNVTAQDDCGKAYAVSFNETQLGNSCNKYTLTRTWTATDACGIVEDVIQLITVQGSAAITLAGVPADATIGCGQGVPSAPAVTAKDVCGNTYTVSLNETQSNSTCDGYTLTRTWTAADGCGGTTTASQVINVQGGAAVTLFEVPEDIVVGCGQNVPSAAPVYAKNPCGTSYIVSLDETQGNSSCGGHDLIRTWTAADGCGGTVSATQTITVQGTPAITLNGVPADITVECNQVPDAPTVTASDACGVTYGVAFQEIIINVNCPNSYQIKRSWTATECGAAANADQLITVVDEIAPNLTCPPDTLVNTTGANPYTVAWGDPVATDNCGIAELVASHPNGGLFGVGVTIVTYTATDECGNVSTCDFDVEVVDQGPRDRSCQEDIHITCDGEGSSFDIVTWEPPTVDLSCTTCKTDTKIAGFRYMGQRGGSRYYCSKTPDTWHRAQARAQQMGGYLACIDDPAENAYLANFLTNQHAFIGLSDEGSEGNFYWTNGANLNFTNWYNNQPNNHNGAQHYVQLMYNGKWNDEYASKASEYIVEIPCATVTQTSGDLNGSSFPVGTTTVSYSINDGCEQYTCSFEVHVETSLNLHSPEDIIVECNGNSGAAVVEWQPPHATSCCSTCPSPGDDIPGFIYMGRFNGHQYYCSIEPAMWQTANAVCNNYGGYLASINSADENDFLAAFLTTQSVFIGGNDAAQEGNFVWASGEPRTFNNWHSGQPNNLNGNQDFVQLLADGTWDDIYNNKSLEFVLELPCVDVQQIEGPENGSAFPVGTTKVTYQATDNCGNATASSFNVTVNECESNQNAVTDYCHSQGTNTDYLWIDHIKLGDIDNCSGNNEGYGNFTSHATVLTPGSSQALYCYPGFKRRSYYTYWTAWIDYNGNGTFEQAEEVFRYKHYQALRVNFRVPHACVSGMYKMRVAMQYGGYASPCDVINHGEVEDYTVMIITNGLRNDRIAESRSEETFEVIVLEDADIDAPTGAGLPNTSTTNEVIEEAVTENAPMQVALNVYPNPVQSTLNIEVFGYQATQGNMTIFNELGQQVHTAPLTADIEQQLRVDVQNYTDGFYFIHIDNGTAEPIIKKFEKIQ